MTTPWKWDVTIYDRPYWRSTPNNHHELRLLPGNKLGLQIWSSPSDKVATDFWKVEHDDRSLVSEDGGMSWRIAEPDPLPPVRSVRTSTGRTVSVMTTEVVRPRVDRKAHLQSVGLGHLYSDTTFYQYQLYPERMREELIQQGYKVHEPRSQGNAAHGAGEGVLATCVGATLRISEDDGRTWTYRDLTELPFQAHQLGFFRDPVLTPSGMIVGPSDGVPNPQRKPVDSDQSAAYCLRSEDDGDTWELVTVAHDPDGAHGFIECHIAILHSERLLMMLRHNGSGDDRYIYKAFSDDEGKTWTDPEPTPMWGYPPNILVLKSGAVLCTYAHRRAPYGVRACLSYDEGETWDIGNEKVLRDDAVDGSISYPTAVHMEDQSIFVIYGINKPVPPLLETEKLGGLDIRMYVAGSRFTEDFVQPVGA